MDVMKAIEARSSVRSYQQKPIGDEMMSTVVRAANLAPMFGRFSIAVIENPALMQKINDVTLNMMKHSGDAFLEKRAATEGYQPLYGAATMIVLSAPGGNDEHGFNMANVSCAAENMIVQATELGLGSCFVMGPMIAFGDADLARGLNAPEGFVPLVGVLVGWPTEVLKANERKNPDNVAWLK